MSTEKIEADLLNNSELSSNDKDNEEEAVFDISEIDKMVINAMLIVHLQDAFDFLKKEKGRTPFIEEGYSLLLKNIEEGGFTKAASRQKSYVEDKLRKVGFQGGDWQQYEQNLSGIKSKIESFSPEELGLDDNIKSQAEFTKEVWLYLENLFFIPKKNLPTDTLQAIEKQLSGWYKIWKEDQKKKDNEKNKENLTEVKEEIDEISLDQMDEITTYPKNRQQFIKQFQTQRKRIFGLAIDSVVHQVDKYWRESLEKLFNLWQTESTSLKKAFSSWKPSENEQKSRGFLGKAFEAKWGTTRLEKKRHNLLIKELLDTRWQEISLQREQEAKKVKQAEEQANKEETQLEIPEKPVEIEEEVKMEEISAVTADRVHSSLEDDKYLGNIKFNWEGLEKELDPQVFAKGRERVEHLFDRSHSLKELFQKGKMFFLPFLLAWSAELEERDFESCVSELEKQSFSPAELLEWLFSNQKRKSKAKEARKKAGKLWQDFSEGGRNFDLKMTELMGDGEKEEIELEEMLEQ
ncbi:hypothetical protein K9M41_01545 [Candidatus Gracilibacteria bacterium]|nr:hypothetical protein [Candidatus Gracilibacteria bacterium]